MFGKCSVKPFGNYDIRYAQKQRKDSNLKAKPGDRSHNDRHYRSENKQVANGKLQV